MPNWLRDSAILLAIISTAFSAGGFYYRFTAMEQHLARMEQHINSVDDYAHGRRAKQ